MSLRFWDLQKLCGEPWDIFGEAVADVLKYSTSHSTQICRGGIRGIHGDERTNVQCVKRDLEVKHERQGPEMLVRDKPVRCASLIEERHVLWIQHHSKTL